MTQERALWTPGGVAALAAFFVLAGYFAYSAIRGEHGIFVRSAIEADIVQLLAERDMAEAEVRGLRRRVVGLSDDTLDLELVDERVREVLGYIRRSEIVLR